MDHNYKNVSKEDGAFNYDIKVNEGCKGCTSKWITSLSANSCYKCQRCQRCCLDSTRMHSCAYKQNKIDTIIKQGEIEIERIDHTPMTKWLNDESKHTAWREELKKTGNDMPSDNADNDVASPLVDTDDFADMLEKFVAKSTITVNGFPVDVTSVHDWLSDRDN